MVPTPVPASPGEIEPALPEPVSKPPARRADLPATAREDRPELAASAWRERHEAQLHAPGRGQARLLVLGDTLADGWYASRSFAKQWSKQRPLNLSLPGEQTQELLWRIEQGALAGLSPRLTLILVGVQNLAAGFSPEETATGVRAVVDAVRTQLPGVPVLLVALLPAGQTAADPRRAQVAATNRALSNLAEPNQIVVADVGGMFINADGTISPAAMSDFLHPTALGYQALTTALSLVAQQLLQASAPASN